MDRKDPINSTIRAPINSTIRAPINSTIRAPINSTIRAPKCYYKHTLTSLSMDIIFLSTNAIYMEEMRNVSGTFLEALSSS